MALKTHIKLHGLDIPPYIKDCVEIYDWNKYKYDDKTSWIIYKKIQI